MITTKTPFQNFIEGRNYSSPVAEIIGLGYYDGVTNGILRTYDGSVFAFDLIEEIHGADDTEDIRRFELKTLPRDAFDLIVAAIAEYIPPAWPSWIPIWTFPDRESQAKVDAMINEQLERKAAPIWVVETTNLLREISSAVFQMAN